MTNIYKTTDNAIELKHSKRKGFSKAQDEMNIYIQSAQKKKKKEKTEICDLNFTGQRRSARIKARSTMANGDSSKTVQNGSDVVVLRRSPRIEAACTKLKGNSDAVILRRSSRKQKNMKKK